MIRNWLLPKRTQIIFYFYPKWYCFQNTLMSHKLKDIRHVVLGRNCSFPKQSQIIFNFSPKWFRFRDILIFRKLKSMDISVLIGS